MQLELNDLDKEKQMRILFGNLHKFTFKPAIVSSESGYRKYPEARTRLMALTEGLDLPIYLQADKFQPGGRKALIEQNSYRDYGEIIYNSYSKVHAGLNTYMVDTGDNVALDHALTQFHQANRQEIEDYAVFETKKTD